MTDSATVTREDAGKDIPVAKLAVASTIGTIIEAYDFVLYGTVAALVFDKLFFPDATPLMATLASFATFGVGFLARPVGGAIFGHYGDKVGRKKMLVLALVIMGVATIADRRAAGLQLDRHLGSDPAGRPAPDPGRRARRRVGRRRADGHRVRAEGQARLLRLVAADRLRRRPRDLDLDHLDHVDVAERRGVRELGLARAVLRVSGLLVAVGLYIRLKIEETPAFTELQEKQEREKAPAVEVIKEHPKNMLRAIGMRCSENITFYMLITFSLTYGEDDAEDRPQHAARRDRDLRDDLVLRDPVLRRA